MALITDIGFELQSTTDAVEMASLNGGSIDTSVFRSGAAAYRAIPSAAAVNFDHDFTHTTTNCYQRVAILIHVAPTGTPEIFNMSDAGGTSRISMKLTSGRLLQLFDGTAGTQIGSSSSALTLDTWYVAELRWSTGTYQARLNGTQFATGTPTSPGTNVQIMRIGTSVTDATLNIVYDDVSLNDDTGTSETSWVGIGKLDCLRPNAAGDVNTFATQTGGTAGAANNFTRVNEVTPNDATSFNGSSTLNQEDLLNVGAPAAVSGDTVQAVSVGFRFRNSTADATAKVTVELEKTGSGTKASATAIAPNSITWRTNNVAVPRMPPLVTYTDPDGGAWTSTTLGTMQIGYKLTTAPGTAGRRVDVSTIWAYVRYTPAASVTIIPSVLALAITAFAPQANLAIIPGVSALTTTPFAPKIVIGSVVIPGVSALTLSTFAPTIIATANKVVTPGVVGLTTTKFAPTILVTLAVLVTPSTAGLVLTTFAPTVTATANKVVTPGVATLILTLFTPDISVKIVFKVAPAPVSGDFVVAPDAVIGSFTPISNTPHTFVVASATAGGDFVVADEPAIGSFTPN